MSDFKVIQVGSHTGFSNQDWFLESKLNPSDKCIFIEPVGDHFKNLVENYNTNFKNINFFF